MKEVSSNVGEILVRSLEQRGLDPSRLIEGLPITLEDLVDPDGRIDWDDFAVLLDRVEDFCGGPDGMASVGRLLLSTDSHRHIRAIGGILAGPAQIYKVAFSWLGPAHYTHLDFGYEQMPDGRLRLTIAIPSPFRDSPAFFRLAAGALEVLPVLVGMGREALVELRIEPRRGVFLVTPPRRLTIVARLRVATTALFSARSAFAYLKRQQDELRSHYGRLSAAHARITTQARQLRDINVMGQELAKHILLEDLSRSLAGLLQDRLGCRGVELWLVPEDGSEPRQVCAAGESGTGQRWSRDLVSGGRPVGRLEVYTGDGGLDEDRLDLLNELVPFLAMALDNARSFAAVRRREAQLEEEIRQRTTAEERRKELEAKILHAQKLESLGVLASGIAHDFNNLLTGIVGNAGLATAQLPPGTKALEQLAKVQSAGLRAAELTRQLLAYAGKGEFEVRPLDLTALVLETAPLAKISNRRMAALRYETPEHLPAVEADPGQLRQIVLNLITNASEALPPEGGSIVVRTGSVRADRELLARTYLNDDLPESDYVFVEVQDDGCGMDAETRARIFDPFFTTKFTGRGLGLAAVMGIVRRHRGAIDVLSAPGEGTTFRVLLPASSRRPDGPDARPRPPHGWRGSGAVLVVDDEEAVRSVSRGILEAAGFTVLAAENGRDGVGLYERHHAEVVAVLLDSTMPVMGGEEAYRRMASIRSDPPVIFCSGHARQEVAGSLGGSPLVRFLQKPFTSDRLLQAVRETTDPQGAIVEAPPMEDTSR